MCTLRYSTRSKGHGTCFEFFILREKLKSDFCSVYHSESERRLQSHTWSSPEEEHGSEVRKYHVYWYRSPSVGERNGGIMTKREREAVEEASKIFPANAWQKCVTVDDVSVRTITLKNLNSSNRYHFKVTSENDAGESEMSDMSEAVKPPTRMQYILMKRELKRKQQSGSK